MIHKVITSVIQALTVNLIILALERRALVQTTNVTRWLFFIILSFSTFVWIYISIVIDIPRLGNLLESIRIF
ncbi:hypothetical protein BTR23_09130 [Alkalihalophilus pseudofirmus]|nr:hypothetical protein BTR23_09130 [Alkalihalophilus pseudofirmus]